MSEEIMEQTDETPDAVNSSAPADNAAAADTATTQATAPAVEIQEETPNPREIELKERLLRLGAEFENFKRRTEKENARQVQRVKEGVLKDLLDN